MIGLESVFGLKVMPDHAEDMEEGSRNDYLVADPRTPSRGLAAFRLVQTKVPRCAREVASGVKMRFLSHRASPWEPRAGWPRSNAREAKPSHHGRCMYRIFGRNGGIAPVRREHTPALVTP